MIVGLSLKTQELTALFLAVRLYCSFVMEYDIHTLLDLATLATTLWVIFMIRFKLKSSYMEDKDNFAMYYVVSFYNDLIIKDEISHLIYPHTCLLLGYLKLPIFLSVIISNKFFVLISIKRSYLDMFFFVGSSLCYTSFVNSSLNITSYCQQDILGILCLS